MTLSVPKLIDVKPETKKSQRTSRKKKKKERNLNLAVSYSTCKISKTKKIFKKLGIGRWELALLTKDQK